MQHYIITYFGGEHPNTPELQQAHFAKYQAWLAQLGDAAVNPMVPYKNTHVVGADGQVSAGSQTAMMGHTVIAAESMEQALEHAKSCPFLDINGTLEVAELAQM